MSTGNNPVSPSTAAVPERRQITVLFCDLVESTRIAEAVDPEDLRELYLVFRAICDTHVAQFDGYIMEYQGDGILASFGYPIAVENSTQRAINAALRLVQTVRETSWSQLTSQPVGVRIGIHTGIVVAGDITTRPERGDLTGLVGATPNVASRLQGLAQPNSVVISEEARQLVEGQFVTTSLGDHLLKGLSREMRAHVVLQAATATVQASRFHRSSLLPMVGRRSELSRLLECWARARSGAGTTVCISGEPGIGKSRLIAELSSLTQSDPSAKQFDFQCSPYYRNSSFFPVIETLDRVLRAHPGGAVDRLGALEHLVCDLPNRQEAVTLIASLLAIPLGDRSVPQTLSPEAAKKRTIECVVQWLLLHSTAGPLLVVVNDIQWIDPTTLALVQELVSQLHGHSAMVVLSYRPEGDVDLRFADAVTMDLGPLSAQDMEQLVYRAAGDKRLPREIVRQILDNTNGVPLFGEELTKAVVRSDWLVDCGTHFQTSQWRRELDVPATLQGILDVRLDRTGAGRRVAQLASILGRKFTRQLLASIWEGDESLSDHLDLLVREGLLEPAGDERESYVFRHALIQKAAYESLLRSTRRNYHQRVAMVLADRADNIHAFQPEIVAWHFTLGGLYERAVPLWLEAAGRSLRRSANLEASAQAEEGLSCIRELGSPIPLKEVELLLNAVKGTALIAMRGWSVKEVGDTFARAAEISETVKGTRHTSALWGLWVYSFMRGDLEVARQYAEQILRIGEEVGDSTIAIEGHWTLGATLYWQPKLDASRRHLETAVRLYDPVAHRQNAFIYGQDPGVSARAWLTFALTLSGNTGDAARCGQEALELAKQVDHPFSTAWALAANTILRVEMNDVDGALELGTRALNYCMEQEQAFWVAALLMAVGWAKARSGNAKEGIEMAERGFAAYQATGARLILSFFAAMLSDCHAAAGDIDSAERWLARGFEIAEAQKEAPIVPTLLLIKGSLLLRKGQQFMPAAELAFREALAKATEQGARIRELQAATALAHLLLATGERSAARAVLDPVVTWFRESGDPSVATNAITLLESCGRP